MFFTYILYSQRLKKYYIGSTGNIEKRLHEHNQGKSTFTKKGIPWIMIYRETYCTKQQAWGREQKIKGYKGGYLFKKLINNIGRVA